MIFFQLKSGDEFDLLRYTIELTGKSRDTGAVVGVDQVGAGPVVHAGVGQTLVEVVVAPGARVAGLAVALEVSLLVDTDARVTDLLVLCTLVDVQLAVLTSPAVLAVTLVLAQSLHTATSVLAGRGLALVDVLLALRAPVAQGTTLVLVHQVHTVQAGPAVRHSLAVVNVEVTERPGVAGLALAAEVRPLRPLLAQLAADAVLAGGVEAGVVALVAVLAHPPGAALAAVAVVLREAAGPAVPAGQSGALVSHLLALRPSEPRTTLAPVAAVLLREKYISDAGGGGGGGGGDSNLRSDIEKSSLVICAGGGMLQAVSNQCMNSRVAEYITDYTRCCTMPKPLTLAPLVGEGNPNVL